MNSDEPAPRPTTLVRRAPWERALLRRFAHLAGPDAGRSGGAVHLVLLRAPHYTRVLRGSKRVEARFCRVRRPPLLEVAPGDVLLFKRVAGGVGGWGWASAVDTFELSEGTAGAFRRRYDAALGFPGDAFWVSASTARFATVIALEGVRPLAVPIRCSKRCRRGWVVLRRAGE